MSHVFNFLIFLYYCAVHIADELIVLGHNAFIHVV